MAGQNIRIRLKAYDHNLIDKSNKIIEGDKMHEWYGPQCNNYHIWLRKIKETIKINLLKSIKRLLIVKTLVHQI